LKRQFDRLVCHECQLFATERERQRRLRHRKKLRELQKSRLILGDLTKTRQSAYHRARTPRRATRPSYSHTASSSSDGGGSGDSDPDQPDPPRPGGRARFYLPLTPLQKEKPRYHNRRPSRCWRLPWSKRGVRARAA
jgi:hypothetical protein